MKTLTSFLTVLTLFGSALPAFPYVLTLPPGISMAANHFNHLPNNRLANFLTPVPDGATVYIWNKTVGVFEIYTYFDGFGWDGDPNPDGPIVNPGEGFFFQNPTAAPISINIAGAAVVATPVTLPLGQFCVLSYKVAATGNFLNIVGSPPQAGFCTRMYRWNNPLQRYDLYSSPGTLTASFPVIPVGESVWIIKSPADTTPPTLVAATVTSPSTVLVEFSEPMNPGPATVPGNYTLSGGPGNPTSVTTYPGSLQPESKFFQLNYPGTLNFITQYVLTITGGLTDLCGKPLNPCTQLLLNCAPPANDICANATTAVVGANPGTVVCATTDGYSGWDVGCPGPDVWYKYTPPCNGQLSLSTCGSPLNTVLSLWDGCPVNLGTSELWGDNDSCGINETFTYFADVLSCQTYYIRVSGASGAFGTFTLTLGFTPGAPANDACANATVIGNGVFPFDNCMATPAVATPIKADVWFQYTPTCSGPLYISTCGSAINTALAVYSGTCAGTQIAFNDDALAGPCSGSPQSYVTFSAVASTPYYIRVGSSPAASTGCGKLIVVGPNPPSGTCPPGMISQGGTGGNVMYTRMFQVTGNSSGTPWAWCISSPCCYWVQESSVTGVLPVGSPPSALVNAFVTSINSKCPQALPYRLTASQTIGLPQCFVIAAYGCYSDIIFSVGPANTPCQNQCVVPNPFDYLPTAGPCSFNPPLVEIPLSKQDCNGNGVDDLIDILQGASIDANGNGIPDECENCSRPHFTSIPVRQQVKPGQSAEFNGEAQGSANLSYQWLLNGNPVPAATESKLVIDPVRITDAGQYQVAVNYGCGQLRSTPATLAITGDWLRIEFQNGQVVVSWDSPDVFLQSASDVNGGWTTLSDAISPHIISQPIAQQFFRLIEK